jgi:hypothetical protein
MGIPEEIIYLSDHFMDLVQVAVQEADRLGMSVILYDEAMYPSGSAGGMVVKDNPEYASRGLKMIEYPITGNEEVLIDLAHDETLVSAQAVQKLSPTSIQIDSTILLDAQDGKVIFTPPNNEKWSILTFIETFSKGTIRGIHFGEDDGEENAPPSGDLLNPEAVQKFIRLTHETYYHKLKEYFGSTIIAMFTDEPDILGRNALPGLQPWTSNFLSFYKSQGNEERNLPALWFESGENTADIRKKYRKAVHKKLTESYYKPISEWCENHQIALTGHPEDSDDIGLLEHFQIPGQDVVWRWVAPEDGKALEGEHSTAGKCSADAARHRGRRRNLNEFLGVCSKESDWALSPGDMKWYMDWLLVRGTNLLCPHAFYYSIDGKRRSHERPPDVGPNNHWWPFYKHFAQYMKRLSWLMTDSTNVTSIAVLCAEDHLPWKIVKPLYEHQVEFNYLEESLLLSKTVIENSQIIIEKQAYSVVIIEEIGKLTKDVIQKLKQFIVNGGEVIVCEANSENIMIDGAIVIKHVEEIIDTSPIISHRELKLVPSSSAIRVSKVKKNGLLFYLFVNEGEEKYEGSFHFKELGQIEKWDPWTSSIEEISLEQAGENLSAPLVIQRRASIVYCVNMNEKVVMETKKMPKREVEVLHLQENWLISNTPVSIKADSLLQSWENWEGMEYFSGTITYETGFEIDLSSSLYSVTLDLGKVYETAHVFMNDQEVGVKMWAPYRLDIEPSCLKNGINIVRVEVTNSMANKMDHISLQSGLIGPVTIEVNLQES